MRTRIKFCGITSVTDALAAVEAGADALGFVMSASPRQVKPSLVREIVGALPPMVTTVGVFVDEPAALVKEAAEFCRLSAIQLQGGERPEDFVSIGLPIIKAYRLEGRPETISIRVDPQISACLFDSYDKNKAGGTGKAFHWDWLVGKAVSRPVILAGGLTPENVAAAIGLLHPYAVDVSSGIEKAKGVKDDKRMNEFVSRVKEADNNQLKHQE